MPSASNDNFLVFTHVSNVLFFFMLINYLNEELEELWHVVG